MKAFADLGDLPEDERIKVIAQSAAAGYVIAVVVDERSKDRYIKKLAAHPVRIIDTNSGPVKNTILVRVGPKES